MNNVKEQEQETMAIQYKPLVYKIARQWFGKTPLTNDDVIGFAYEGLVYAMNNFTPEEQQDPNKKRQTFPQYAAYQVLYYILNGLHREGHIVRYSAYNQKKDREAGKTTFLYKSLDTMEAFAGDVADSPYADGQGDGSCGLDQMTVPDFSEEMTPEKTDDIYNILYDFVESRFNKRDCDIFYRYYGLKGYRGTDKPQTGTIIAKKYHLSNPSITLITKRIIQTIKADKTMMNYLEELAQN